MTTHFHAVIVERDGRRVCGIPTPGHCEAPRTVTPDATIAPKATATVDFELT